jgi:RNA polymerase sigma-70 factor (ECF subfamily)
MSTDSEMNYRSDDETLVYHCLAGDENAFGFLVHKYKDLVHAYAYQKVSNYEDAEDITQEVFIRGYRNLAKLRYPHKFRSWLYTIASNECNRWLAKRLWRREKEISLEQAPEDAYSFEADFAATPTDWQLELDEALEKLPEGNRTALSMFYMSDCSLKEISEYLGVSVNTVKVRLHRGRRQLGNALSERLGYALSEKKLKGGFIMQIMEQLRHISRPMIPPAWQGYLLRQIPTAIAMAACVLMGVLGLLSAEVQDVKMSEASRLVLGQRQSSARALEVAWLGELPESPSPMLAQAATNEKTKSEKDTPALAGADALLAAKKYRQAAGAYRLLLDSTSSDEIMFSAYYGLGESLYKWDRTASLYFLRSNLTKNKSFNRTDEAIGMLMLIPEENKHWRAAQLLLGRCFLRKGIWAKDNAGKQEYYETAMQAFQDVLSAQTTDNLPKQAEYLRTLCQIERGEADPKTPAVRKQLEMALQDEDATIRFMAAATLNMPIPGMRIVGTVADKLTGQPVTDAPVSITGIGNDRTDGQGRFSIDNLPGHKGEAILWVDMKGYGKKMVQFMISETETETQIDVQLGPGAKVVGRVVDSDGQPIIGAGVGIISDSHRIHSVKTDAKGKYQFESIEVQQNAYRLSVEHPDFIHGYPEISISKTGIVKVPDVELIRGVTLKGRVTDELGNPLQSVKVNTMGGPGAQTDVNGEYHLQNLSSIYATGTIVVDSPNFMPAYKKIRLDTNKERTVNFALKPGKTLVGRVVDEQGKSIEGVKLQFQTWAAVEYDWFEHYAVTDANGEFCMEHLPDGNITLRLDKWFCISIGYGRI